MAGVVRVRLAFVPLIVSGKLPLAACRRGVAKARLVVVPLAGFGLNVGVAPAACPLTPKETAPLKPFSRVRVSWG